jgi:tRNA(fMet)-specific endonuclease VapC
MIYLLDTDHLSVFQRKRGAEFSRLSSQLVAVPRIDVGISVVTFHEQVLGCHSYLSRSRTADDLVKGYDRFYKLLKDIATVPIVPFDAAAAAALDSLKAARVRLDPMDLRIAAIALANNLTLLTRNTVDFSRVPGLNFEDWVS